MSDELASLTVKEAKVKHANPEEAAVLKARAWLDSAVVRRLEAREEQGTNMRTYDVYFSAEGKLVFLLLTDAEGDKKTEARFYFDKTGTKLVKWIGADKEEVPKDSHDFKDFGDELVKDAKSFKRPFAK